MTATVISLSYSVPKLHLKRLKKSLKPN